MAMESSCSCGVRHVYRLMVSLQRSASSISDIDHTGGRYMQSYSTVAKHCISPPPVPVSGGPSNHAFEWSLRLGRAQLRPRGGH
jgi:hypothetical protein